MFGDIADGAMRLNDAGRIVKSAWDEIPRRFPGIIIDEFIVMPDHVHGIVFNVGAQFIAPYDPADPVPLPNAATPDATPGGTPEGAMNTPGAARACRAHTLGAVVRAFKAASTRIIRMNGTNHFSWQRNYWERIVRDDAELNALREYIRDNPKNR